jgi:hypothetical protein
MVYLLPAHKSEPKPSVGASCGGVAVGGNVTGAIITGGNTSDADCSVRPK